MTKLLGNTLCFLLFVANLSYAEPSDSQVIDQVMRDVAINFLISDDRKIPKKDRQAWEAEFADCVDFESLNASMRANVRTGLEKDKSTPSSEETLAWMGKKAVAFYLPRMLNDITLAHLKIQKRVGTLPKCSENPSPAHKDDLVICTERSGRRIQARWITLRGEDYAYRYSFEKTDRWRLVELSVPMNEKVLVLIGRWK